MSTKLIALSFAYTAIGKRKWLFGYATQNEMREKIYITFV